LPASAGVLKINKKRRTQRKCLTFMGFCMWDGVGVAEMFFIDSRSMSHGF